MEVVVLPRVFRAISSVEVATILSCSEEELRPILACLVRQVSHKCKLSRTVY